MSAESRNHSDPATALALSQTAPSLLAKPAPTSPFFPLSLLSAPETPELWTDTEALFLACLKSGDDKSAHLLLQRLKQRFGPLNERVMGLRGLYQEAMAENDADLKVILAEYSSALADNPMNVPILKRRIALLRTMRLREEAIGALVDFLGVHPTDAEAWCELSELYQSFGMSAQAMFCLEEALLMAPNAWNLHARLGELGYIAASPEGQSPEDTQSLLTESIRRFSRSIELCDDYLRGYFGLKLATQKLLQVSTATKNNLPAEISRDTLQRLNNTATERLSYFVRSRSDMNSIKIGRSEIIAAKALLDKAT